MTTILDLYSLNEAAAELNEDRNLVTFLMQDRSIPHRVVGRTKVIDSQGLATLREEVAAYRSKAVSAAG